MVLVIEVALFAVLVPVVELCQYQVIPDGGLVLVNILFPQLLVTEGVAGVVGTDLIL